MESGFQGTEAPRTQETHSPAQANMSEAFWKTVFVIFILVIIGCVVATYWLLNN
jgi:hypothetical protein